MKGSQGAMLNTSPSTFEKYNQKGIIEETANQHIDYLDDQDNEQHKHWLLYENGRCNQCFTGTAQLQ